MTVPIEFYSPMNNMGGIMLCHIVANAIAQWELANDKLWGAHHYNPHGYGIELYKLLVKEELKTLGKELNEENFNTVGKDAIRFLELAIENAEDQIIGRPFLDPLYDRVRVFHYYFSAYRENLILVVVGHCCAWQLRV